MNKIQITADHLKKKQNFKRNEKEIEVPALNLMVGLALKTEQDQIKRHVLLQNQQLEDMKSAIDTASQAEKQGLNKKIKQLKADIKNNESKLGCATVKIQNIPLDTFLRVRGDVNDHFQNLIDGVISAMANDGDVADELKNALKSMSNETRYQLMIVKEGCVDPKFSWPDVIWIGKNFPMAISQIYHNVMAITNDGSTLKKNSIDS